MVPLAPGNYERLFRVIHGVLLNERSDPARACLYFGIIGAEILRHAHDLDARCVAGAMAYCLPQLSERNLAFGKSKQGTITSDTDAFHVWIEAQENVIDLQAPLFNELIPEAQSNVRAMIQIPKSSAAVQLTDLSVDRPMWSAENADLLHDLKRNFMRLQANLDLIEICKNWYKPVPKDMQPRIRIGNQHGIVSDVPLSPIRVPIE